MSERRSEYHALLRAAKLDRLDELDALLASTVGSGLLRVERGEWRDEREALLRANVWTLPVPAVLVPIVSADGWMDRARRSPWYDGGEWADDSAEGVR